MASWALAQGGGAFIFGAGSYAYAAKGKKEVEKAGLLDWITGAMDKETFTETDPILNKVEGKPSPGGKPAGGKKPAAPQKKGFFK